MIHLSQLHKSSLKGFSIIQRCTSNASAEKSLVSKCLMENFGLSNHKTTQIIKAFPSLHDRSVDIQKFEETTKFLRQMKFTDEEILSNPFILLVSRVTLENRIKVIEECCFKKLKFNVLNRFIFTMNRTVKELKVKDHIDPDVEVQERLLTLLDVDVELSSKLGDNLKLRTMREIIIDAYLKKRLGMTDLQIVKLRKVYHHIIHRNLQSIVGALKILQEQLNFTNSQIINNGFLITASPENINQLLIEIDSIGGISVRDIIKKRPCFVLNNPKKIKKIIEHIRSFDISEELICKAIDIFCLHPSTVYNRLVELSKEEEYDNLRYHKDFLQLVLYHNKAKLRMKYLKDLGTKFKIVQVLTGPSGYFEKNVVDFDPGLVHTNYYTNFEFISRTLTLDLNFVRKVLKRHPNCHLVPTSTINKTLEFLHKKKFNDEAIKKNLYLLLYPISKIEPKLNSLIQKRSDGEYSKLSDAKLLQLCLYFIEIEFHMTGDGVFDLNLIETDLDSCTEVITEPASNVGDNFVKALSKGIRYGKPRESRSFVESSTSCAEN